MQVPAAEYRRAHFGPFAVDLVLRTLEKDGCKIKLQEKPFQILAILVGQPGELVTREELRARLWPADTFVDFEHSINTAIKKLREALDDDAEGPRYIETLPKRGYRFIAQVEASETNEKRIVVRPVQPVERFQPVEYVRRIDSRFLLAAATALLIVLLVGLQFLLPLRYRLWSSWRSKQTFMAPIGSVAVLPLQNLSQDPSQEYFADGLTDALITDLGKIAGLRVISHTSASAYRKTNKPMPQIARELNVDAIVEGTVLRASGRLRVTVQLVRASPEEHVWAERYERDDQEVIPMERHLALTIAHEITGRLITADETARGKKPTSNPKAYDSYLRGRYFWNERSANLSFQAGPYFEEALRLDPNFALAYSGLADYYSVSWGTWIDFSRAEEYARKAVALEPDLAQAHASLGIAAEYQGKFKEADNELKRAIELNPNYAMAHHWYAIYLASVGRLDDALVENERARRLDPFSLPVNYYRAAILLFMHRYEQSAEQLETVGAINPQESGVPALLASIYWLQGKGDQAIAQELKAANLAKDSERRHEIDQIARTYARAGLNAAELEAARLKEKACLQESDQQPVGACDEFGVARLYGLAGDRERALYWLGRAVRHLPNNRNSDLVMTVKVIPELDCLRSDSRFLAWLHGLQFPE